VAAVRGRSRADDLIGWDFAASTRPDQWWVGDFTYVWTRVGFCYVSSLCLFIPGAFWGVGVDVQNDRVGRGRDRTVHRNRSCHSGEVGK
jgi:hypothetical protein